MKVRFFDPGLGYSKIKTEIDAEMQRVLAGGDLILRQDVDKFEENLAAYVGTKYAVAVASGTDALILSLVAAGIGLDDEVITSSYTFRATIEAICHVGAIPILADLGEDWRKYKSYNTKAVIPCHIAGEVQYWETDPTIPMIEDACQAIGATPVRGLAAAYSFYPAKILGCYGDGGGIATNSEEMYLKLKQLRNHDKGAWAEVAYNSRLDNIQAAVLNVKIKYLPDAIKRRKEIAQMYDTGITHVLVKKPSIRDVYQDYIIESSVVIDLQTYLWNAGIETMFNGYPFPAMYPKKQKAREYEHRSLRLPCNENLTNEEVQFVIDTINGYGV